MAKYDNTAAVKLDLTAETLLVDLKGARFQKSETSGKVSASIQLKIGNRSVGSVLFYAPADSMSKEDKGRSKEANGLTKLAAQAAMRGDAERAKQLAEQADAAQRAYETAQAAARMPWDGKPVIEALHAIDAKAT